MNTNSENPSSKSGQEPTAGNRASGLFSRFNQDRDFNLFLITGLFAGISTGISISCFNNYLNDIYHLTETARGIVEVPREMPGALLIFIFAIFAFMSKSRLAALGMILSSAGMLGLGVLSPSFGVMLVWMIVYSFGLHICLPLTAGIGMSLSKRDEYGVRLGRYNAYNLAATMLGYFFVWLGFSYLDFSYSFVFTIGSLCFLISAVFFLLMKKQPKPQEVKHRFVIKKRFSLYYVLSIVNGARKQVFMTFAPWVLIKIYHLGAPAFALLGFVIAFVSIATRTAVGRAIDRLGERLVLSAEAVLLIILCMGYAFSENIFPTVVAMVITAACYVVDNSLNAVEMARSTYVQKIADNPDDVVPTLSTGASFDHVVSMTVPYLGGLIWAAFSYKLVFIFAAIIAVINLFLSFRIRIE